VNGNLFAGDTAKYCEDGISGAFAANIHQEIVGVFGCLSWNRWYGHYTLDRASGRMV